VESTLQGMSWLGGSGGTHPPIKILKIYNVDAKSCNLRVFWSEKCLSQKDSFEGVFFPSNMKIMKFDI
jgi:hypothetical protein